MSGCNCEMVLYASLFNRTLFTFRILHSYVHYIYNHVIICICDISNYKTKPYDVRL